MEQITNDTKPRRKHLTMEERLAQLERKEKKALAVETKRKARIAKLRTALFAQRRDAFAKASGTQNKELLMIEGASHIRTYWLPEYVDKAVKKLGDFFSKNL